MAGTLYLQTDIGSDIDDTWALAMILKSPELKLKMVLTDTDDTVYRAALACRMLQIAGREDVEVAAGIVQWPPHVFDLRQRDCVAHYDPDTYPRFNRDGVNRFIEAIRAEPEPVALVAIGPVPTLAAALRKAPDIASKIDFYGMFGSVYRGYDNAPEISAEYNVLADVAAARTVFAAKWHSVTITPLDTCGLARLDRTRYGRLLKSEEPLLREVIKMYREWNFRVYGTETEPEESTILYDTVAVHMAMSEEFYRTEEVKLIVDDKGFTRIDPSGAPIRAAVEWTDLEGYCDDLTGRLLRPVVPR